MFIRPTQIEDLDAAMALYDPRPAVYAPKRQ